MQKDFGNLMILHGASKKNSDTFLKVVVVKNEKNEKKNFLCSYNDQFKQIFFVGGVIFNEKNQKIYENMY